jgi:hypothetical protein
MLKHQAEVNYVHLYVYARVSDRKRPFSLLRPTGAQMGYALASPGTGYFGIVAASLILALAIIAATFPLLARITGPETARNE